MPAKNEPTANITQAPLSGLRTSSLHRISDTELAIDRTFHAKAHHVFDAWTQPEFVKLWWAPAQRGVRMVECVGDVRPQGTYRYVIGRGETERYAFSGTYLEIERPTRLVYTQRFEGVPGEATLTIAFIEQGEFTTVSAREVYPNKEALDGALASGMEEGMNQTYEQLDELMVALRATPQFRISRVFDAPKHLVFKAWSKAEYVARWFTPAPLTTPACEVDLRVGGAFNVTMRTPDGMEFPMVATFTEVIPNERIVYVARIHGGLEVTTTVTLVERDGKTTLSGHQVYSREDESTRGAHAGWTQTLHQLGEMVAELAK